MLFPLRDMLVKVGLVTLIVLGSVLAAAGVVFATGGAAAEQSVRCPR